MVRVVQEKDGVAKTETSFLPRGSRGIVSRMDGGEKQYEKEAEMPGTAGSKGRNATAASEAIPPNAVSSGHLDMQTRPY